MPYRYVLAPRTTVNCFKAKPLPSDVDWSNLKSAELGAVFKDRFNQVPKADHCGLTWEAGSGAEIFDK